jgi:hypothetical protein
LEKRAQKQAVDRPAFVQADHEGLAMETVIENSAVSEAFQKASVAMREALVEEGFEENGSLSVFFRAQSMGIEELARLVCGFEQELGKRCEDLKAALEAGQKIGEQDLQKLKGFLEGAEKSLELSRKAVQDAGMAQARTSEESERAISKIALQMSGKLLEKTQGWLVLRENKLNRRDPWRNAAVQEWSRRPEPYLPQAG